MSIGSTSENLDDGTCVVVSRGLEDSTRLVKYVREMDMDVKVLTTPDFKLDNAELKVQYMMFVQMNIEDFAMMTLELCV